MVVPGLYVEDEETDAITQTYNRDECQLNHGRLFSKIHGILKCQTFMLSSLPWIDGVVSSRECGILNVYENGHIH